MKLILALSSFLSLSAFAAHNRPLSDADLYINGTRAKRLAGVMDAGEFARRDNMKYLQYFGYISCYQSRTDSNDVVCEVSGDKSAEFCMADSVGGNCPNASTK